MSRVAVILAVCSLAMASCAGLSEGNDEEPSSTLTPSTEPATTVRPPTTTSPPVEVLTGVLQFEIPTDVVRTNPGCDTQGAWREFVYAGMAVHVYASDGTLLGESRLELGELKPNDVCHFPFAVEVVADAPNYDLCLVGLGPNGPIPLEQMREDFNWELVLATGANAPPPTAVQPCSLFWE